MHGRHPDSRIARLAACVAQGAKLTPRKRLAITVDVAKLLLGKALEDSPMKHLPAMALLGAVALGTAACSDSPSSPSAGSGSNFNLRLRDAPFADAKAVLVTFSSVRAHRSDSDWTALPFTGGVSSRTCDLKKLETAEDVLGTGSLPAGHYTQVRLVVQSAVLYFDNPSSGPPCAPAITAPAGASASLDIPSGEVKLNREFDLVAGASMNMLVDFDGNQSIHLTGSGRYMMSPVVTILSVN